ncbi:zinc-binding protein [Frondihabitans sp. PAMC 28766]|uniref:YchJ family protein n=1 Tax=Frondihabitans sp. PAMC 28766 TaxID=1795630 RepID=UPI00078D75A3|nr:YchJ family metal-binding protein [Frondihabitans sp. PAMC 28766]AMM20747.1 zinc-binding protein [Frondihabitans sp. PAMC 28766]
MPSAPSRSFPTIGDGDRCPCLSGETYGSCCGPLHRGSQTAPTATRLMRSRYSAFVVGDAAYLLATWDPATRPAGLELDPAVRWFRLEILGATRGGLLDTTGTVEFAAHYRAGGSAAQQRETSRFAKRSGRWLYVDAL